MAFPLENVMFHLTARISSLFVIVALSAACGCSSGPAFYDVTGTVQCDGKPVEDGEIIFVAEDNASTPAAGKIQNGAYQLRIPAGKKKVKIAASRKLPGKGAMGEDFVYQSYIPPRYNDQTTLEAEVGPGSANQFNFKLDSKPAGK
jgi:hypothetical protein